MGTRIDLRVHAGASTAKKDDDRFKAQAAAYLNFRPGRRTSLISNEVTRSEHQSASRTAATNSHAGRSAPSTTPMSSEYLGFAINDTTICLDDTQLGYTALGTQLHHPVSSVHGDRVSETRKRSAELPSDAAVHCSKKEKLTLEPPSAPDVGTASPSPSQSSYLRSPVLHCRGHVTEKGLLVRSPMERLDDDSWPVVPADALAESNEGNSGRSGPEPSQVRQPSHAQPRSESFVGDEVSSQLPSSYSLSETTECTNRSKLQSVQRSVSDPALVLQSRLLDVQSASLNQDEHVCDMAEGRLPSSPQQSDHRNAILSKPVAVNTSKAPGKPVQHDDSAIASTTTAFLPDLPILLLPPTPETSIHPLKCHLTPNLALLATKINPAVHYRPVTQTRSLRLTERGCWTFSIATWSHQHQRDFFDFLGKTIEAGRVGWGVCCMREEGMVKVFCWGELVMHVYLFLYAGSKGKVSRMGLRWVDAEGEVVVQMKGEGNVGV